LSLYTSTREKSNRRTKKHDSYWGSEVRFSSKKGKGGPIESKAGLTKKVGRGERCGVYLLVKTHKRDLVNAVTVGKGMHAVAQSRYSSVVQGTPAREGQEDRVEEEFT